MSVRGGIFQLLTKRQIYDIHATSMEVLERTGVVIKAPRALKLLHDAGAIVDFDSQRVWFPTYLVEEMVRKAPSRFTLYARDKRYNMRMEDGRVHYGPAGVLVNVIDLETGERRRATLRDAENLARIVDALENVHEGFCLVHPFDVPDNVSHVHMYMAMAKNTGKVPRGRMYSAERVYDQIRMAAILAGGEEELRKKPNIWANLNPISPLQHAKEQVEGMLEFAKWRLPVGSHPRSWQA